MDGQTDGRTQIDNQTGTNRRQTDNREKDRQTDRKGSQEHG